MSEAESKQRARRVPLPSPFSSRRARTPRAAALRSPLASGRAALIYRNALVCHQRRRVRGLCADDRAPTALNPPEECRSRPWLPRQAPSPVSQRSRLPPSTGMSTSEAQGSSHRVLARGTHALHPLPVFSPSTHPAAEATRAPPQVRLLERYELRLHAPCRVDATP